MLVAPPESARPASARQEWRRAGTVVLSAHIGMATGPALYYYVSSLFVVPLQETFGWSRGEISAGAALGLLGSLSAPFLGKLADRFGAKPVAMGCSILLALTFAAMSRMTGPFFQFIILSAIFGIITPGCTALTFSRAVTGWFVVGRGQALGVMAAGVSVGALLFTPLVAWTIVEHGVQAGFLTLAGLVLVLGAPAIWLGLRERSTALAETAEDARNLPVGVPAAGRNQHLWETVRSRGFIALAVAVFATNVPGAGVLTQLDPLLLHNDVESRALLISIFALAVLVGRIFVGWLFDKADARFVAALFTVGGAAGCLMLLSGSPSWLVFGAVILVGFLQGMEIDAIGYFVARQFSRMQFGVIFGILLTISMLGTALGVVGFGALYDATQSYDLPLILAALILFFALWGYLRIPARPTVEAGKGYDLIGSAGRRI